MESSCEVPFEPYKKEQNLNGVHAGAFTKHAQHSARTAKVRQAGKQSVRRNSSGREYLSQGEKSPQFALEELIAAGGISDSNFEAIADGTLADNMKALTDGVEGDFDKEASARAGGPLTVNVTQSHQFLIGHIMSARNVAMLRVGQSLAETRSEGSVGGLADVNGHLGGIYGEEPSAILQQRVADGLIIFRSFSTGFGVVDSGCVWGGKSSGRGAVAGGLAQALVFLQQLLNITGEA